MIDYMCLNCPFTATVVVVVVAAAVVVAVLVLRDLQLLLSIYRFNATYKAYKQTEFSCILVGASTTRHTLCI